MTVERPSEAIAGYPVVRRLGDTGWLCLSDGRHVVLKHLDTDCLLGNHLHPAIKQRLARVRELAHAGAANLFGVERDGKDAWLVWEYINGHTLEDVLHDATPGRRFTILRDVVLAIESLHACGIVHGALHERNILIDDYRHIRLTHLSPLLYTEPTDDESAFADLISRVTGEQSEALNDIEQSGEPGAYLRALRSRLNRLADVQSAKSPAAATVEPTEPSPRRLGFIAAAFVSLIALAIAFLIMRSTGPKPIHPVDTAIERR